jgi:hypothetical protein
LADRLTGKLPAHAHAEGADALGCIAESGGEIMAAVRHRIPRGLEIDVAIGLERLEDEAVSDSLSVIWINLINDVVRSPPHDGGLPHMDTNNGACLG